MDNMTPKASEVTASLQFFGPDYGTFPASAPSGSTAITGLAFNELKFNGAQETKDFKAGQQIMALERIVSQASSISGSLNMTVPSSLLSAYAQYGPLVLATLTSEDPTDAGNYQTITLKGLMKLPDVNLLGNPGTIDFEIRPYGVLPTIVVEAS